MIYDTPTQIQITNRFAARYMGRDHGRTPLHINPDFP
jgi:hypothetical protein